MKNGKQLKLWNVVTTDFTFLVLASDKSIAVAQTHKVAKRIGNKLYSEQSINFIEEVIIHALDGEILSAFKTESGITITQSTINKYG